MFSSLRACQTGLGSLSTHPTTYVGTKILLPVGAIFMPSAFLSSKPGGPYLDSTPPVVWDNDGLWINMNYYYYYFTCMV